MSRRPTGRPPGRPRHEATARASDTIYLRCTPSQRVELDRVAAENHCRISELVREAIGEFCAAQRERQPRRRR